MMLAQNYLNIKTNTFLEHTSLFLHHETDGFIKHTYAETKNRPRILKKNENTSIVQSHIALKR